MINFMNKEMQAAIDNLSDAHAIIFMIVFYTISILQLPIPEIFNMLGIVVIFTLGINIILSSDKHSPTHR